MSNKKISINGIGFLPALTLIFITLKLTDVIDWAWWIVLSPIVAPFAIFLAFLAVMGILWVIAVIIDYTINKGTN